MREVWLLPNRRAVLMGMVLPALMLLLGLALTTGLLGGAQLTLVRWLGGWLVAVGGLLIAFLAYLARLPRLAYADGELLVFLRSTEPLRLPIEHVECFFLGEGPSMLETEDGRPTRAAHLVVRLAEAAKPWHNVDVKPALGKWEDGYITIRGAWCQPLSMCLVNDLNARLVQKHGAPEHTQEQQEDDSPIAGQRP